MSQQQDIADDLKILDTLHISVLFWKMRGLSDEAVGKKFGFGDSWCEVRMQEIYEALGFEGVNNRYLPGKGISVVPPKTKSSVRTLPLPDVAYKALLSQRASSTWPIVFATSLGTYFYPRNILRHFQAILEKLELPKMPFHNLRHSCASYHLAVGTNPKVVQELLGHSTITITLQTYSHLLPGVDAEAAKNINQIFT